MRLSFALFFLISSCSTIWAQLPHCQINSQTRSIIFNGNKLSEHNEYELQINTAKGTKHAEINIGYKKGNSIKELEAAIYDISGNKIRSLKKKDIIKTNTFSYGQFHSDDMVLSFKLIHNQYPYIIKYSYREEVNEYLYLAYWVPRHKKDVPVKQAQLKVEVPTNFPFRIIYNGIDSAQIKKLETTDQYVWTALNVEYPEKENYGPELKELFPKVVLIPETFKYGVMGNTQNWQTYGNWNYRLKKDLDLITESEKTKIHALTDTIQTKKEKVNVLYKYMQDHTRYINVALDIGGLQPISAESVCTNKYGDCKALSNYMYTILKEIGIKSVYTTVYAGARPKRINSEYPSQQFNHVILCVPLESDTLWLECTDSTSPFNYLGSFTQNRTVLLVKENNSKLVLTPALSTHDVLNTYKTNITISTQDDTKIQSSIILKGTAFDYLKSLDDGLTERDKKRYLEKMNLFANTDIETFEIHREHRDSAWINLNLSGSMLHVAESIGQRLFLKPINNFSLELEEPKKRSQELIFNFPLHTCDSTTYVLPRQIQAVSGIKNESIVSEYGTYHRQITFENNKLVIYRRILYKAGTYNLNEYPKVYQFIQACSNAEDQKAIITYKATN